MLAQLSKHRKTENTEVQQLQAAFFVAGKAIIALQSNRQKAQE